MYLQHYNYKELIITMSNPTSCRSRCGSVCPNERRETSAAAAVVGGGGGFGVAVVVGQVLLVPLRRRPPLHLRARHLGGDLPECGHVAAGGQERRGGPRRGAGGDHPLLASQGQVRYIWILCYNTKVTRDYPGYMPFGIG